MLVESKKNKCFAVVLFTLLLHQRTELFHCIYSLRIVLVISVTVTITNLPLILFHALLKV